MLAASPTRAGHHQWDISEAFSNASGTVQYVEMIGLGNNEQALGPWTLTSTTNTLNFVTNLPSSATLNTWVLCATSNFAGLPGGITPDYIIPANFFPTAGGTLNYATGAHIWNYGAVPTDGILALQRNGTTATNSPRNFAGASGSVDLLNGVPMIPSWGLALLVGALLLAGSGLLRKREVMIG